MEIEYREATPKDMIKDKYQDYLRIAVIAFDRKTHFYQIIQYLFGGADGNIKGDKML